MFTYTLDNKRYHTLNYEYKNKYQCKIAKISLNANLPCPNFHNNHGCIYCSESRSGDFGGNPQEDLITQFYNIKKIIDKKWSPCKYIAYFQAGTNTYAPVEKLKTMFEPFLNIKDVVGIDIATRSDAINDEVLNYLIDLNHKTDLTIELGLQSIHERTLKLINRGHTLENFTEMVNKLHQNNIKVVVHIINSLPYETEQDMLETIKYLNNLPIDGIKIHMLAILKNTPLAAYYQKTKFKLLTKEEYIDIVIKQLQLLRPEITIHRITSDPNPKNLIAPQFLLKKTILLNDIDKEMKKRNTYQGRLFIKNSRNN